MTEDFLTHVNYLAETFLTHIGSSSEPVRIVANIDADGLASAAILAKAFTRHHITYTLSLEKQITDEVIKTLQHEPYSVVFFTDLGASHLQRLHDSLEGQVFVLDHHPPDVEQKTLDHVHHLNPHSFGMDGTQTVAAAGVVYFFAKSLDERNVDLSPLALVGAIGDAQEDNGFTGLNKLILDDAVDAELVDVKESLRLFGMQTKPLHKVLECSTSPYIPGVTGNERAALQFIEDLGIPLYDNAQQFRKLMNLTKQELDKLATAIEMNKSKGSPSTSLLGPVYLLKNEEESSLKKDLREFSTLLNSCGRMGWPSLGIGVCFGDLKATKKASDILKGYQKEILDALNWFYNNRRSEKIIEKEGYVVLLAEHIIRDTIIGTLASLIARSNIYPDGTVILSSAYTLDGMIKISTRCCGKLPVGLDLREVVTSILVDTDGYGGGHKLAAGASIPQENEEQFIRNALAVLEDYVRKKPVHA